MYVQENILVSCRMFYLVYAIIYMLKHNQKLCAMQRLNTGGGTYIKSKEYHFPISLGSA